MNRSLTKLCKGCGLVVCHPSNDLLLESSLKQGEFGEIIMDSPFNACFFELIDVNPGAGGLFDISIVEAILGFLLSMWVLESYIKFLYESIPSRKVGRLGVLSNEFQLVFHPLLCSAPHEAQGKPDLLLIVHRAEDEIISALCQKYGCLGQVAFELVGHVGLNVIDMWLDWWWGCDDSLECLNELLHHGSHVGLGWSCSSWW